MEINKDYERLYLKYKLKYLKLKNQIGGYYNLLIYKLVNTSYTGTTSFRYILLMNNDIFMDESKTKCISDETRYNKINEIGYYENEYNNVSSFKILNSHYETYIEEFLKLLLIDPKKIMSMSSFYSSLSSFDYTCYMNDSRNNFVRKSNYESVFTPEFLKSEEFANYETNLEKLSPDFPFETNERGFFLGAKKGMINFALSLRDIKEKFDILYLVILPEKGAKEYYKKLGFIDVLYKLEDLTEPEKELMFVKVDELMSTMEFKEIYDKYNSVQIFESETDYYGLIKNSPETIDKYNRISTKYI